MKINESKKDKIVNKLLYILSLIRSKIQFSNKQGKDEPDTDKMNLVFRDYFNSLNNSSNCSSVNSQSVSGLDSFTL